MSETRYVTVADGTRLAWDELGSGPNVVMVHGLGSSRQRWSSLRLALGQAGFRALRFDLRGFGDSTPASFDRPHGMAELVSDLDAFTTSLGLERFHLVGHSLGGMVAQRYAVEHRERVSSLVLASTTSHNGRRATAFARAMVLFSEHGFDAVLADPVRRPDVERALREAFPGMSDPPLEMLRIGLEEADAARANAWRACIDFSEKDRIGQIACPVLVLHGTGDPLIPFVAGQLVHEAIAHSEWIAFDGAGHSLPTSRAASFDASVVDFLRRADSASE